MCVCVVYVCVHRCIHTHHAQDAVHVPAGMERKKVVYMVTCVARSMGGLARDDSDEGAVHERTMSVLSKAGYDVIIPNGIAEQCCGLIFDSRGYPYVCVCRWMDGWIERLIDSLSDR